MLIRKLAIWDSIKLYLSWEIYFIWNNFIGVFSDNICEHMVCKRGRYSSECTVLNKLQLDHTYIGPTSKYMEAYY